MEKIEDRKNFVLFQLDIKNHLYHSKFQLLKVFRPFHNSFQYISGLNKINAYVLVYKSQIRAKTINHNYYDYCFLCEYTKFLIIKVLVMKNVHVVYMLETI